MSEIDDLNVSSIQLVHAIQNELVNEIHILLKESPSLSKEKFLILAIKENKLQSVNALIEEGTDINAVVDGTTALRLSVEKRFPDIVNVLIRAGANVHQKDDVGVTPLMVIKPITNANEFDPIDQEIILSLKTAGAFDINHLRSLDRTVLGQVLASKIRNEEIDIEYFKEALTAGADLDSTGAIFWAIDRGKLEIIELLIGAGANVNVISEVFGTPLTLAAGEIYSSAVRVLIAAGADVNQADLKGITPLIAAVEGQGLHKFKGIVNDQPQYSDEQKRKMIAQQEGYQREIIEMLKAAGAGTP